MLHPAIPIGEHTEPVREGYAESFGFGFPVFDLFWLDADVYLDASDGVSVLVWFSAHRS